MTINKDNYEAFLLDQMEGNLTPAQEDQLEKFLAKNPELLVDAAPFEPVYLQPEPVEYPFKQSLKKRTRVIGFTSGRLGLAVAAAVVGIMAFAGVRAINNAEMKPGEATATGVADMEVTIDSDQLSTSEEENEIEVLEEVVVQDEHELYAETKQEPGSNAPEVEGSEVPKMIEAPEAFEMEKMVAARLTPKQLQLESEYPLQGLPLPQPDHIAAVPQERNLLTSVLSRGAAMGLVPELLAADLPAVEPRQISGVEVTLPGENFRLLQKLLPN